ncbi:butyrate kinase [Thermotoga sp. KOL6]|uniref:butyrate kinase n=1 Tax=Thermotoga sp. KOL6 TaxID=126741 RepID=UPI000C76C24C|nr:butyrate kinase [Thermotoga sp. KOL6]PLV60129.1 butyrate kinase [Thermotoga sp. KOL6]
MYRILVINPGSTSTKVAIFEDETKICEERITHSVEELMKYERIMDQEPMRRAVVERFLENHGYSMEDIDAIGARGGILEPVPSGTYKVDEYMVDYLLHHSPVEHVSNLAAVIGYKLGKPHNIPCFITDPVSVDEMCDEARFSGLPDIERKSYSHALNIKAVARKVAKEMGKPYEKTKMVVVHLGSGISVTAHLNGKMIDVNNANDEGPFSVERTGELPVGDVVKTAYSGKYTARELKKRFVGKGGLVAYLGTNDLRRALEESKNSEKVRLVVEAMAYQIAKEIGGMCAVLGSKPDAIIITGGMAHSLEFVEMIRQYVRKFGSLRIVPGEFEMEALALGVLRVLKGEEKPKDYKEIVWRRKNAETR